MKKILLLAVVMFASLNVKAQQSTGELELIPKIGFNLANLAGDVNNNSIKFALFGGAEAMYQVSPMIGLSGGLLFSAQGCEFDGDVSESMTFLNIPCLANFYVAPNLALKIGLQPAFCLSAKIKDTHTSNDLSTQTIVLDLPFGISYEFGSFMIDARYNLGLSKTNKNGGSIRNSVFQIGVGYKIPLF